MAVEALFHGASFGKASCQSASTPAKCSSLYSEIIGIELPAARSTLAADYPRLSIGPKSRGCSELRLPTVRRMRDRLRAFCPSCATSRCRGLDCDDEKSRVRK